MSTEARSDAAESGSTRDPIKVLQLIKGLGPGGAEQLLLNQANVGLDADVDFHVAYLVSWKDHHVDALRSAGWTVHWLASDRAWDLRWLLRFHELLRREKIDVVHGHSPLVSGFARLAMRTLPAKLRPRSIYTEHNEWARHRPWTRRLNRATIGLEDHVLAVSEAVKKSMSDSLDVQVLIHGIDIEAVAGQRVHREVVRAELGIANDETVIGIVANFRKEKAYDVLVDAATKVAAENPNVRFVSVGQGPLEQEIRAKVADSGMGDRFLILGYRPDATRIMSAFDIFTLASHHEGLPVSLMDAIALGLPVVATTVGGIPKALESYQAILVPPGDVDGLATGYAAMIERLDADAPAGRPTSQMFDARVTTKTLADRYRRLAGL